MIRDMMIDFFDMFKEILDDIFSPYSTLVERCRGIFKALLASVVSGLFGILVLLVVILVFTTADSMGIISTKTAVAVVEAKETLPAHVSTTVMFTGKVAVLIPIFHQESYQLLFKISGRELEFAVNKQFFDSLKPGDKIEIDYGFGRITGSPKPVKIRSMYQIKNLD